MRRFLATLMIAAIGTTVVGAGIALAAEIEVTPANPTEGTAELTIDVWDFDPNTPIFAVPCAVPDDGGEVSVSTADCDISVVESTTTDNEGRATITVTWDIPEDGIAVYVGDEARENQVSHLLTPETLTDDGNDDVEVLGTSVTQEDLADTGPREVMFGAMAAAALIGLGLAFRGAERMKVLSA